MAATPQSVTSRHRSSQRTSANRLAVPEVVSVRDATPFFGLSAEQIELRDEVRRFAVEQVAPRARALEWHSDIRQRVDWELVEEASRRGWRTFGLPREDGGAGAGALDICLLVEELAYGDMGFAVILDQTMKVQRILAA